jgi:hypothetical protein
MKVGFYFFLISLIITKTFAMEKFHEMLIIGGVLEKIEEQKNKSNNTSNEKEALKNLHEKNNQLAKSSLPNADTTSKIKSYFHSILNKK